MKILMVCKKFPYPPKDGETIAIFNHIKGFSEAGHQVTVASINTIKHHVDLKSLPEEIQGIADFHAVEVDTTPKPIQALLNLFQSDSYHLTRFISSSFVDKLKDLLTANHFDIIQLEGLYLASYVGIIRKHSRCPVVMRSHNVEHEIWERITEEMPFGLMRWYLKLQGTRLARFEASMINQYTAIVPITSKDAERFRSLGCKVPMHVSPAGIDLKEYGIDQSVLKFPSVFFLGGLDWIPNQEGLKWFIENVWKQLSATRNDCKFYIAGRNAPKWIQELRERNVEFVGEVEDAKSFMNSKAIMVVPLFAGSGMRIKIIEGMAMGKAIISTSIGAEGIDYLDGGNILIANSAYQFYQSLISCLDDEGLVLKIGKSAVDNVQKHYSNNALINSLLDFYSQLMNK